ncbi:hypothetical protein C6A87_015965 [Mycobacterium sp. ITM-2016-00317]|uniref:hypothetical protein n=1 Tax=Mycobacterium sp. ITM-2016-00317 TaxID=2099694 RepID=UPI00287F675E|nr:hypothetical protein [Mycobacterium sp. ITM-2016-00317]WNG85455.1 hypothetical protein C6A87_015965 [Mycobacterium sp. ITM-2016-00317]
MRHITEVTMMKSGNGPEGVGQQDPDADPEMKTSGAGQQSDQAEGEDDSGERGT